LDDAAPRGPAPQHPAAVSTEAQVKVTERRRVARQLVRRARAGPRDHPSPGLQPVAHDLHPRGLERPHPWIPSTRQAAGREDLRWHDLRHTGAVLAAQTAATLAELMGRLGHSTPGASMRYQHAAADRGAEIAQRLSDLASG
jgi:integrase